MKKKILSMFLAAAMTVSITTSIYAAGETETTEHIQLTDKIFNTTVVSENNGGSSTYGLNNEPTYTVNLELTDGTEEIEDFTITDTEGQCISSQISNTNNSVQISGLVLDELYIFNSTVDGTPIRGAVETLMDGDTVVAVTDVYDFSELEAAANNNGASPRSSGSTYLDSEVDDTSTSYVYELQQNIILQGIVHSASDSDLYEFTVENDGLVDFKLLVPEDLDGSINMSIYEYNSTNNTYTHRFECNASGTTDEFGRIAYSSTGTVYRVQINTMGVTLGGMYYFQIENRNLKAWFPQAMGVDRTGTTYYWNTNKLDLLYYPTDLSNPFTNNSSGGSDKMSWGCSMAACAMVLANMDARTIAMKNDFRISQNDSAFDVDYYTEHLTPDPYTVFLVNNSLSGTVSYDGLKYVLNGNSFSMSADWSGIADNFAKITETETTSIDTTFFYFSDTEKEYIYLLVKLANILNNYPSALADGVILRFNTSATSGHSVVITYENSEYYVYDPGNPNKQFCRWPMYDYFQNNYIDLLGYKKYDESQMAFIVVYS